MRTLGVNYLELFLLMQWPLSVTLVSLRLLKSSSFNIDDILFGVMSHHEVVGTWLVAILPGALVLILRSL